MKQVKVLTVVGARPHFIKVAGLNLAMKSRDDIQHIIVHSGQHYDDELSANFFQELDLPEPDYHMDIGSVGHNKFIGQFLIKFDEILDLEYPDMVIVLGDTDTTAAAAIGAAKRNVPIAHVEAGLREWDKSIPEEVNKLLTDAVTDLYFSPTPTGIENLRKQGIEKNVFLTGDINYDLLHQERKYYTPGDLREKYNIENDYVLMTCHRAANTRMRNLTSIISATSQLDLPVIWPLHPRTSLAMERDDLFKDLGENIIITKPLGFWETQSLIKNAQYVITDSGGIIKESYFHRTPSIIIDLQTEWLEIVNEGWAYIAGPDRQEILAAVKDIKIPEEHLQSLTQGTCGKIILDEIMNYLHARK